uniref:Uncharacterized protein n=1 Tax=Anopheles merus TaxID=30066 RepID=A0A182VCN9_ANOME
MVLEIVRVKSLAARVLASARPGVTYSPSAPYGGFQHSLARSLENGLGLIGLVTISVFVSEPHPGRVLSRRCTRTCTPGRARKALTLARMLLLLLQIDGREIVNYVRHFDYFALITLLRGRWSDGSKKSEGWRRL